MITFRFETDSVFESDLMDEVRAFFPYVKKDDEAEKTLRVSCDDSGGVFTVKISGDFGEKSAQADIKPEWNDLEKKRETKRIAKVFLYDFLKNLTGVCLPYGSLTGIRPTKLFRDLEDRGEDAERLFLDVFECSKAKTEHVKQIVKNQKPLLKVGENEVDFFVNIPFCPTRCAYCSFVSVAIDKLKKYLPDYVKLLKNEISILKNVLFENNLTVRAVYFGGGTPTSLPADMLASVLSEIDFPFKEFTVEAGRPDTVTKEKLNALKNAGVTRISINPQTFWDKTLRLIGRDHTVEDFYRAAELAGSYDFDVNFDLIAMLPEETFEDFKFSVDSAVKLSPENITVHTLSLKRGSELTLSGHDNTDNLLANQMVFYADAELKKHGYLPYYMYRQKHVSGNLENTGYAKEGKICIYNVDIMEESTSILAAGAGSISKRVFPKEGRIERQADFKAVKEYVERFEEVKTRTENFWK